MSRHRAIIARLNRNRQIEFLVIVFGLYLLDRGLWFIRRALIAIFSPCAFWRTLERLYPVRVGLVHLLVMMVIVNGFPPPPQISFILVPVAWGASFGIVVAVRALLA